MEEQKEKYIAKFIHKPYKDYCSATKEKLKSNECVYIYYLQSTKNEDKIYSHYAKIIKKLDAKQKTILFYGVPIRLSPQQYYVLYLLLINGYIDSSYYAFLSNLRSNKKMKKSSINGNLRSFMSDFKNKLLKIIEKYKEENKCYFSDMTKNEINPYVENLVCYEKYFDDYIIKTQYKIKQKERIKFRKEKLKIVKTCKNEYV